jgi:hypothetical protein
VAVLSRGSVRFRGAATDARRRFERTFTELTEADRELFYSKNFEQMMGERVLTLA